MKVYVIKNDKNEYMTETGDFIKSLWQAELFYDYECAYCYAPSGCNIVECSLMEKYQLADYTKQVRKEVCEEIREWVVEHTLDFWTCENDDLDAELYEFLDQIEKEK